MRISPARCRQNLTHRKPAAGEPFPDRTLCLRGPTRSRTALHCWPHPGYKRTSPGVKVLQSQIHQCAARVTWNGWTLRRSHCQLKGAVCTNLCPS